MSDSNVTSAPAASFGLFSMRLGVIRFGAVVEISCVDVGNDGSTVAGVDEIGTRVLKVVSQHR